MSQRLHTKLSYKNMNERLRAKSRVPPLLRNDIASRYKVTRPTLGGCAIRLIGSVRSDSAAFFNFRHVLANISTWYNRHTVFVNTMCRSPSWWTLRPQQGLRHGRLKCGYKTRRCEWSCTRGMEDRKEMAEHRTVSARKQSITYGRISLGRKGPPVKRLVDRRDHLQPSTIIVVDAR